MSQDWRLASELAALRVELQARTDERDALRRGLDSAMRQLESAEAALQDARLNALVQVDRVAQTAWQEQKARAEKAEAALQDAREALRAIAERIDKDFALHPDEPLGMVTKPHICWATDALSMAGNLAARAVLVEGAPRPLLTGKHPRDVGRSTWALDAENDGRNPGDAQGASGGEGRS